MTDPYIPITSVELGPEVERRVLDVLRSGHIAQGPVVAELEAGFASMCGVADAIAVNSGTTALIAALEAHGVGPGDEVVTAPLTFAATINAVIERGATVRFADIDPVTYTLDPAAAATVVTDRTAAIMPVHLYGLPADMEGITALAQRCGAVVVEDAAQAHGATFGSRPVGSFGTGCFSLYATKNMTTAEGGIVTTDDPAVADAIRVLRNQGMRARYEYERPGHNWRLTDLQAAVGLPLLERLADLTDQRRANAALLAAGLADLPGVTPPSVPPDRTSAFHQFTVRIGAEARLDRDTLASRLHDAGIGTGIYYPRLAHDYDCYRTHPLVGRDATPIAAQAAREVLSLPVHPGVTAADGARIVDRVRALLDPGA